MGMPAEQAVSQMQGGPINRQDAMARMAELAAKHRPQQPEPAAAPEEEGGPSFNLARGAGERAADLAGGALEFAGDVGRNLDEAVSLGGITWEGMLPEYRGPKAYAEYMAGKTDWLQQGADAAKAVDLGYEPNVTWEDVKGSVAEGPRDFFANLGGFAIEQFVVSSPDMLAVMANLPAYVVARSGELSQARAEADGKEQPETGDILIGTTAAVVSAAAERLGLDRLIKGLKGSREGLTKAELKVLDNVNEVVGAALVVGTAEGATEAIQEAVEYVAVQVGTEEGANLADLADSMLAGVAGGGTIGAGVGAAGAAAKQVREGNLPEVAAERAKQVREQIKTRMAGAQPGPQPGPQPAAQPGPQPAAQPGPQAGPQTQDQTAVNEVASGKRPAARVTDPDAIAQAEEYGLVVRRSNEGTIVTTEDYEGVVEAARNEGTLDDLLKSPEKPKKKKVDQTTVPLTPEKRADQVAAIRAVMEKRKDGAQVTDKSLAEAAHEQDLSVFPIANGFIITRPENDELAQWAIENKRLDVLLGYAEPKEKAVRDRNAKAVRPVDKQGASPGAQLVSEEGVGAAVELAKQQAGPGGTVEIKSPEQELADRVGPEKPLSLKERNGQVLNTTPKVRDIANDNDIDLAEEIGYGSGAKGRIVVGDVMKVVNAKKKATEPEPEPKPEPEPEPAKPAAKPEPAVAEMVVGPEPKPEAKPEPAPPPVTDADNQVRDAELDVAAEKQTEDFVKFYEPRTGDKHEATVYQQLKKWALRDDWREQGSIKAGNRSQNSPFPKETAQAQARAAAKLYRDMRDRFSKDSRFSQEDRDAFVDRVREPLAGLEAYATNPRGVGYIKAREHINELTAALEQLEAAPVDLEAEVETKTLPERNAAFAARHLNRARSSKVKPAALEKANKWGIDLNDVLPEEWSSKSGFLTVDSVSKARKRLNPEEVKAEKEAAKKAAAAKQQGHTEVQMANDDVVAAKRAAEESETGEPAGLEEQLIAEQEGTDTEATDEDIYLGRPLSAAERPWAKLLRDKVITEDEMFKYLKAGMTPEQATADKAETKKQAATKEDLAEYAPQPTIKVREYRGQNEEAAHNTSRFCAGGEGSL